MVKAAKDWGWLLSLGTCLLMAVFIYSNAAHEVTLGTLPEVGPDKTIQVVPAAGPTGYPVDVFCADPLTELRGKKPETRPDSRTLTYTLERLKDGKREIVIWRDDGVGAEYWTYNAAGEGEWSPGIVNDAARKCILGKVK